MAIIKIPYQLKNGVQVDDSGCTQYLAVNTDNYEFCGDKFFAFRIVSSVELSGGGIANTFEYNGDLYTDSSLATDDLIIILASIFSCGTDYGCRGQAASFDWELTPIEYEKWTSTTIVHDVSASNYNYTITDITVAGISYGVMPYAIWTDGSSGNASSLPADYIDEIIEYIESLNIPEYQGARNLATNGMADNLEGVGLLELYFTSGTTVNIDFASNAPSTGTMNTAGDVVVKLELEIDDTSSLTTGDAIELLTSVVSDGTTNHVSNENPTATLTPYNILATGNLDINKGWVLNNVLNTEMGCVRNNVSTAIIPSADILDAIDNVTTKTGSSVA